MDLGKLADEQRLTHLYYHLCACLAIQQKASGEANALAIAKRLGDKNLRRVISKLLKEDEPWVGKQDKFEKLGKTTTGDVVLMLQALNQSLREDYRLHEEPYTKVLSPEDILAVLHKLINLTPDERKALNLPSTDGLTLLQRALLILQTTGNLENHEVLFQVYKAAVGLSFDDTNASINDLDGIDSLVAKVVQKTLAYLPERSGRGHKIPSSEKVINTLTRKAQREIRRLLTQSGNQISRITNNYAVVNSYISKYLRPAFVTKLAQTVVANERLTDQFPIYLKRITIKPSGPLPFPDRELDGLEGEGVNEPYQPLLHRALRQLDRTPFLGGASNLPEPGDYELASQKATEIVAEFYIKIPENYPAVVEPVFRKLVSEDKRRMDFSLRSTGVGGTLSHVIKVINTALLGDIRCLRDYFPIGHDIVSTQKIIQDDIASPVWSHSLVKLCRKDALAQTLKSGSETALGVYEEFSFADPIGHADYCGFDFITSQAQSALHARLQAIRFAGVSPTTYIQHLCQRTERLIALQDAWSCLKGYPFSSLAMTSLIHERILLPKGESEPLEETDSYIYFDACLSVAEALLEEGLYRSAYQYLRRVRSLDEFVNQGLAVDQPRADNFEIFSGALIIRYLLCLANYYYLYDLEDGSDQYLPPRVPSNVSRELLVQRAWSALSQAQTHVRVRLRKYAAINEVSQGIFNPHYLLLSKIALLRAKLMLFFPKFVPLDRSHLPTENVYGQERVEASIHWGRLYLTEKARLYAAANGESEIYAHHAAVQSWIYLIAYYAGVEALQFSQFSTHQESSSLSRISRDECLKWSRTLRDHALLSYAECGKRYYYQIKEKSGLPKHEFDRFGDYYVQKLSAIFELQGNYEDYDSESLRDYLVLDMSLLAIRPEQLLKLSPNHPEGNIYLFGSTACYLFFIRGLYMLCGNESEEFEQRESASEIDWKAKLLRTIRLFDMAWSIAEEGCELQTEKEDGHRLFRITRESDKYFESRYSPSGVQSIRDLYPCRVTEIADLAKIFAAASMMLYAYTLSSEERETSIKDVEKLLDELHSTQFLKQSSTLRALINKQARYNGHLAVYLKKAKEIILACRSPDEQAVSIREKRDNLLRELFNSLKKIN